MADCSLAPAPDDASGPQGGAVYVASRGKAGPLTSPPASTSKCILLLTKVMTTVSTLKKKYDEATQCRISDV